MLKPEAWLGVALVLSATACQAIFGFEDFEAGRAGAGGAPSGGAGGESSGGTPPSGGTSPVTGGASSGGTAPSAGGATASGGIGGAGGAGGAAPACPAGIDPRLHGPEMALLRRLDGTCFWMDTTEVTRAQYAEFLQEPPLVLDGACSWKSEPPDGSFANYFAPDPACVARVPGGVPLDGGSGGDLPMTCVDYCDAAGFCLWAGKELCGDDGAFLQDAARSDWYLACTAGAVGSFYSCGGGCDATACNGRSSGSTGLAPVRSYPSCAVPAASTGASIYDLSGNASEWTSWCSPNTEIGDCLTRGGAFGSADGVLQCRSSASIARKDGGPSLGFRCCANQRSPDGG